MPDDSWSQFPEVPQPTPGAQPLTMETIPQMPLQRQPITTPTPTLASTDWEKFPAVADAVPAQTPAVTTGPATLSASSPILGTYRAMSFGPGDFPGADKPTNAVMYGALQDAQGNPVKMTTSDIAMSPNVMQKHGLKLGDHVDLLDGKGNVIYSNQRIGDKSYISKGKPTTDSIELWGRPEPEGGFAQIRRAY